MRIPLFIEFSDKKVAVIGGGYVGTSRAKKFLEAGAEVTVFSLEFSDELQKLEKEKKIKLVKKSAEEIDEELKDFDLVVVAIENRDINKKFKELSKKYKFLLNLANDAKETEVVVPFEGGKEGIRFAVTTEGKSGVAARKVRDEIQRFLEENEFFFSYLAAMDHLKRYMKSKNIPVDIRMKLYGIIGSNEELIELSKRGEVEAAKNLVERLVDELCLTS